MIARFERFLFSVSELSRCWHKIAAEELEQYGLKGPHATYLTALYRHGDGLTAPQLCELCGKDKADVSRMVGMMEKKGLVTKQSVNQSLYRGVFKLTEAGMEAAEHVRRRASLAVELAGRELTEEDRAIFWNALDSIVTNLQELSKDGLPKE